MKSFGPFHNSFDSLEGRNQKPGVLVLETVAQKIKFKIVYQSYLFWFDMRKFAKSAIVMEW